MHISTILLATVVSAVSLTGSITGVPEQINELYDSKNRIINGESYQLRFDILLSGSPDRILLKEDYTFNVDIPSGNHTLTVHSYDFALAKEVHELYVANDTVFVGDEEISQLEIPYEGLKPFYVISQGSLGDMVLNSPFGFIFKNSLYTFIFMVTMGIAIAPTLLAWFNPELAELLRDGSFQEEIDRKVKEEEAVKAKKTEQVGEIRRRK